MEPSKRFLCARLMTAADLPFADSLRAMAGWNQTLDDWKRFLLLESAGCFIAEWDGKPVGTATTIIYGPQLGWIGMLLVHPQYRLRGIGTILLERCIEHLRGNNVACIKLDATPAGKEVYRRLGFEEEWTLTRWEHIRVAVNEISPDPRITPLREPRGINALDSRAFGVSRERLISRLAEQSRSGYLAESEKGLVEGFGLVRSGARSMYLGPVVADSPEAGIQLIEALLKACAGEPCYWDIPDQNAAAMDWALARGFQRQRSLTRMRLGENLAPGEPLKQFAIAGPEVG